jgi:uncharacterized YigZ family protein
METRDSFLTIGSETEIELKIKNSKFIGRIYYCRDNSEAEVILGRLRKKCYDANHNCFAYQTGLGKDEKFRYSDDGEPSGTAGRPIYDRIVGRNLTNVLVVVTRYFGGTKLGTGGLTRAYSDTAGELIEKAGIIEKYITEKINMVMDFPDYNNIERLVKDRGGKVIESKFTDNVRLSLELRKSQIAEFKSQAIEITSGRIKFDKDN